VVRAEFAREYRRLYGRDGPNVDVEVASVRVVSSGPEPGMRPASRGGEGSEARRTRSAYFGNFVETPVYDDAALEAGATFAGPAIVEQREATLVVPPGATCLAELDASLTLRFA
jgi:N-methylhydantoinase A